MREAQRVPSDTVRAERGHLFMIDRISSSLSKQMFILSILHSEEKINTFLNNFFKKSKNNGINTLRKDVFNMTITNIKVRKLLPEGRLKGIISLTLDDAVAVHDIKVVQGDERLFVAMPSRRDDQGVFRDIIHPISQQARNELESRILQAYREALEASIEPS